MMRMMRQGISAKSSAQPSPRSCSKKRCRPMAERVNSASRASPSIRLPYDEPPCQDAAGGPPPRPPP